MLAGTTWSFIKVTPGVESGLPHTRGDHIVLSEFADALAKLVVAGMFGVDAPSGEGLDALRK